MTPYRLHHSPSTAALAVHWMLIELGVPFELEPVDFATRQQRSPAFLAINPSGRVPVLLVDGEHRTEVAALLMLLAERHPQARFAPEPGAAARADYLQQTLFMANTLQPLFRAWYYPQEPAGPGAEDAVRARAEVEIGAVWARYDARFADGRTHLLGEAFSVADMLLTMLARWSRNLPRPAETFPHLGCYIRSHAHPSGAPRGPPAGGPARLDRRMSLSAPRRRAPGRARSGCWRG